LQHTRHVVRRIINDKLLILEIMAKPIKETPVLKGKDAQKFYKDNQSIVKATSEELARIKENYEALKSIAKFAI
jgi:hypothetical protein